MLFYQVEFFTFYIHYNELNFSYRGELLHLKVEFNPVRAGMDNTALYFRSRLNIPITYPYAWYTMHTKLGGQFTLCVCKQTHVMYDSNDRNQK